MRPLAVVLTVFCLFAAFMPAPPGGAQPAQNGGAQPAAEDAVRSVQIEWYGQACFLITTLEGAKIVIDPFDPEKLPYTLPPGPVTLAFASHDHSDHNYLGGIDCRLSVKGGRDGAMLLDPLKTIPGYGTYTFGKDSTEYKLRVVPSFHDEEKGEKRGPNIISVWDIDGLRIVHMGDQGCALDARQVECMGIPDVLLIPVGGHYTIDAEQARAMVKQLSAHIVVPMHFKTKAVGDKLPIAGVDEFMKGWDKTTISKGSVLDVIPGQVPEGPEVVLLKYHGQE